MNAEQSATPDEEVAASMAYMTRTINEALAKPLDFEPPESQTRTFRYPGVLRVFSVTTNID